jgi:hypothetical protein
VDYKKMKANSMAKGIIFEQRKRIAELEATMIRIAALAYSYNAETPDKRFVELGEAARVAAGEAKY